MAWGLPGILVHRALADRSTHVVNPTETTREPRTWQWVLFDLYPRQIRR